MKLLVGTNNPKKVEEIRSIFNQFWKVPIDLLTPSNLTSEKIDIPETGITFAENSKIKTLGFYNIFGLPTIADDSGLIVDQLGGEPGVNSARYAGENANDAANRNLLKFKLATLGIPQSSARFVCVITYYDGTNFFQTEGVCPGTIVDFERGNNGFGYDPMFIPEGYNITFAEMDSETKNKISHRSIALVKMAEILSNNKLI